MAVFKNQGYLTITAETGLDLTSATNPRILYKNPNGTTGHFVATKSGTQLVYQCSDTDLDIAGEWQFQAFVEIGGLNAYGEIFRQTVETPIS